MTLQQERICFSAIVCALILALLWSRNRGSLHTAAVFQSPIQNPEGDSHGRASRLAAVGESEGAAPIEPGDNAKAARSPGNTPSVLVPEQAMKYFHAMAFFPGKQTLDKGFCKSMGFDDQQVENLNMILGSAITELQKLETKRAELKKTAKGDEFYYIPALGAEGKALKELTFTKIRENVDDVQFDLTWRSIYDARLIGRFGDQPQELSIVDEPNAGANAVALSHTIIEENGTRNTIRDSFGFNRIVRERYGHLFKQSQ